MDSFKYVFLTAAFLYYWQPVNLFAQSRYDVNRDGKVNVSDAVLVVNEILNGANTNHIDTPAEAIDLGLPSGTKWAGYNLGASSPEESGGYFAWGEMEEKIVYNWDTYSFFDRSLQKFRNIGNTICGTLYDAAHIKWGGLWHMPTKEETTELMNYCSYEWTTYNGVKGGKFTGPNGKSIFLPAMGRISDRSIQDKGKSGYYWSAYDDDGYGTGCAPRCGEENGSARRLFFDENGVSKWMNLRIPFSDDENYDYRSTGLVIRPVYSTISTAVDLGLPSGLKWASCNLGASCPEEIGGLYAWGETGTKLEYTWDNYLYYDSSNSECLDIGSEISGTKYDAAHVKLGGSWRMPTNDELEELISNCKHIDFYINGISGILFIGPNGNSIFLPHLYGGLCWSSSLLTNDNLYAYCLDYGYVEWLYVFGDYKERYYGCPIRPVSE